MPQSGGKLETQKMAVLLPERLSSCTPFTYVSLDVFWPWNVVTQCTRGGATQRKRWAILFTCMSTTAVHVEVIDTMGTASCINALHRFFALRGPAKQLPLNWAWDKMIQVKPPFLSSLREWLYLRIQSPTFIPHGRSLGAHDWRNPKDS